MPSDQPLTNRVKTCRVARGWSQDELAVRAGISRAGVSAIETNRLVPSTSAALALAAALDCRVEDLFQLGSASAGGAAWAWPPQREPCRYWRATIAGREWIYPTEPSNLGVVGHDGVFQGGQFREQPAAAPADTLVVASCDPAIGLLADELARRGSIRLLALQRSSKQALALLARGWCTWPASIGPRAAAEGRTPRPPRRACTEDFACCAGRAGRRAWPWPPDSASAAFVRQSSPAPAGWDRRVRPPASCLTNCCRIAARRGTSPRDTGAWPRPSGRAGPISASASAWSAMRLDLNFLAVREEQYDYCYPAELEGDPRIQALMEAVRSSSFRGMLGDLPGYDAAESGELQRVV